MAKKNITLEHNHEGFEMPSYKVWVKDRWTERVWTTSSQGEDMQYLHVHEVHFRSGNSGMPTATLGWRYGSVTRPGEQIPVQVNKLDLAGYFLKIEITPSLKKGDPFSELKKETWYGVAWNDTNQDLGHEGTVVSGKQVFQCFGLEWLLNISNIQKSYWNNNGQEELSEGLPAFNDEGEPNQAIGEFGNGSLKTNVFQPRLKKSESNSWITGEIIKYLMVKVPPLGVDENQDSEFIEWRVKEEELDKIPEDKPTVQQDGRTHWEMLRSLISKYRLVDFKVELEPPEIEGTTDPGVIDIKVFTMTDVPISVSNEFIADLPENSETIHLDVTRWNAGQLMIRKDRLHKVDRVVGKGDYIVTVVTAATQPVGGVIELKPGWEGASKATYDTGGKDDPDYPDDLYEQRQWVVNFRSRDELQDVYSRFELPENLEISFNGVDYTPYEKKILRATRLQEGVDYSGTTLEGSGKPEREIFAVIQIPNQSRYVYMDRISSSSFIEETDVDAPMKWSASIRVERDYPAISLVVRGEQKQHVLTTTTQDGVFGDEITPEFDPIPIVDDEPNHGKWLYGTIHVTMAIQDERKLTVVEPPELDGQFELLKTLEIDFGESYQWTRLLKDTVVGIDIKGNLATAVEDQDIRNDTDKLTRKVKSAYGYYSKDRFAIELQTPFVDGIQDIKIGDFIQTVAVGRQNEAIANDPNWNKSETVNAVVTKKSYFFPSQESEFPTEELGPAMAVIETSFGELDFGR